MLGVRAGIRHLHRHAVRCESESSCGSSIRRNGLQRNVDLLYLRLDETGVVVEDAQLVDLWCPLSNLGLSARDVLSILTTPRVRAVRARHEGDRALHTVVPVSYTHLTLPTIYSV